MAVECEVKLRVEDADALRESLRRAGARRVGCVLEDNTLLDTRDGRLHRAGCGLRLRLSTDLGVAASAMSEPRAIVTFKGPRARHTGDAKIRPEWEAAIDAPAHLRELLAALGLAPRIRFEKRRETWSLGAAAVTLDELPGLGFWMEIEAATSELVAEVRAALGLAETPAVTDTYAALAARYATAGPSGHAELRFEPPASAS